MGNGVVMDRGRRVHHLSFVGLNDNPTWEIFRAVEFVYTIREVGSPCILFVSSCILFDRDIIRVLRRPH